MSPKPTKTSACEADSITENIQQLTLETQPEDLYELLHDAPDNCFPQQPNNPEIMTPSFSARFGYKRKKRKRQSPYGLSTRPKAVTPTKTKTTFKPYLRKSSYNIGK